MKRKSPKRTAFILGTRPEIIKLSPILRLFTAENKRHFVIHTGQHYSYNMDRIFFRDLGLKPPEFRLNWPTKISGQQGAQTSFMLNGLEKILNREKPSVVIVQGDTNSVLAATLAAVKMQGVKVAHVEAGLRSYDKSMPEEINRILADHGSDLLFAPTELSRRILEREGIDSEKIYVTGNTVVDAMYYALGKMKSQKVKAFAEGPYFLLTLHRQENVDSRQRLQIILSSLERAYRKFGTPIIFPIHPRTMMRIKGFGLSMPKGIRFTEPVGYYHFLNLEKGASLILTDSGGVQEEACVLKVPCVTLRENTERPETVAVGANIISGYEPRRIEESILAMLNKKNNWRNPFGDGQSAKRILHVLSKKGAW